MKTKELGRQHIEHLINIGYATDKSVEELIDSPYILFYGEKFTSSNSVKEYKDFNGTEKTKEQILKLRPIKEKENIKTLTKKEQKLYQLLKLLNTNKYSKITGYDVSWDIQEKESDRGRFEIFPISPQACGSISMEHLEIILDFAKKNTDLHPTLSYTNYNKNKERYGTYRPCIYFY